ncbi:MAG: Hsp70 family protein [Thermoguttaceae bacterium]
MTRPIPVGIDLGTTNSAVAWVDESGRSQLVRNADGELLTPSIVLFDEARVVVGKEARGAVTVSPEKVAEWVKRDMGEAVYSHPIHGQFLPPEVIQACILRRLKEDLVRQIGPGSRAVITVPAYFDEPRRKATVDAAEMAGLSVLDIVNEPTAAALAFGEMLGYLSPEGEALEEMTILVYDLGGGTFDATLLKLAPGDVKTLATDGDVRLGGHDWDQRLVDHAAEAFKRAHGTDPRQDPAALKRLFQATVEAKHSLSARKKAVMRVEFDGRKVKVPVTRVLFEEMTSDLLERTAYTTRQLLVAAGLQWSDVSRVLLVGGSTRMPMVGTMLQGLTGIAADHTVNPDEAVARGAGLYAAYLTAKESGDDRVAFEVTNVNSHSLGIEGIDQKTMRKTNVILIPRNTPLPAEKTDRFVTKSEGQRSIVIRILEGESPLPSECTVIGKTGIRDLPAGLPKGWPIEVTFQYGANGRLSVHGTVPGTHKRATLEMDRAAGLSNKTVTQWKQPVTESAGFDAFEDMLDEVLGPERPRAE